MQFRNVWFGDEVREGFLIPSMMKRVWAAQEDTLPAKQIEQAKGQRNTAVYI